MVAGKLTIASPIPDNEIACYTNGATTPSGAPCTAVAFTAPGLGYRSFDFQVTKNFNVRDISTMYVRLDVLNAFNVKNLVEYVPVGAPGAALSLTSAAYKPTGNISGSPRELRMSIGAKF